MGSRLQDKQSFAKLKDRLAAFGVLAPGRYSYPDEDLPGRSELEDAFNDGHVTTVLGSASGYEQQWTNLGRRRAPKKALYRITKRAFGPFYFSRHDGIEGSGGRFDIAATASDGTMYLAHKVAGAISEVYGRILVLDVQAVTTRLLWEMRNVDDIENLLDLTSKETGDAVGGIPTSIFATMNRPATQLLATESNSAGYRGLIHLLKTTTQSKGYAIFGAAGANEPEKVGLGTWSCKVYAMAESDDFWQWVESQSERSRNSMHTIFNQLPFEKLLPK